ncbi:MAG: glycosyltransferase [Acidimicrobiales bacterium]
MRVLVVSGHYPPNFVSGGTLVPRSLARGLRARGHDVSVYAGWLGPGREPLDTWDEEDETGLAVRWIATTPWTAWSDRRTYDNPPVAAAFARYVDLVRPDVVHLHSLQSLGAGLLDVAGRRGARVVVTMHDFWWVCARQFLVDRAGHPCPLVVDAADCQCEVDHDWLAGRNAWLRERLAAADLVLAPSRTAAEVLAANGVAPARLEVDENGLAATPPSPGRRPEPAPGAPLRLVYTGGADRMKGVHVLLAAAARIADRTGWCLRAYGIDRYLKDHPGALDGLAVEARPAFDPERLDEVLAGADVVVVPSVMRESHSLITREALVRGVPVVSTDCIGPEEVVADGANGLLVPTDDHRALAAAIERLLDDPPLLVRLREGCHRVRVRTVDDQVAALQSRYARLVAGPPSAAAPSPSVPHSPPATPAPAPGTGGRRVVRVVFLVGIDGAPLRYRAWFPAEALGLVGVATEILHYRDSRAVKAVAGADAVVVYRVPATPQVLDLVAGFRAAGTPAFFDVDDLIFDPDLAAEIPALGLLPPDEAALWLEGVRRYRTTMEACDAFIGSTGLLCRHAHRVTGLPAFRFDNGVGTGLGRRSAAALARPRTPGPTRVAYLSGTTTHEDDWAFLEPVVVGLLERVPDIELWLGGHVAGGPALHRLGHRVRRLPYRDWTELPALLRDVDVNLAPLTPGSRFNEAKSAIKWLEAALVATPTVASPTEPFGDAVVDGETALLAATPEDWAAALELLVVDHARRDAIGSRARRAALLRWSPHLQARRYLDILTAELPPRAAASPWVAVANDEPFTTAASLPAVSPEAADPAARGVVAVPSSVVARARSLSRRAAARYEAGGLGALAAAAARAGSRRARAAARAGR